jgi:hypothetical protein
VRNGSAVLLLIVSFPFGRDPARYPYAGYTVNFGIAKENIRHVAKPIAGHPLTWVRH